MRHLFFSAVLFLAFSFSALCFADQDLNICEANPAAPQCAQARAKIPDSLPESYSLNFLIASANSDIQKKTRQNIVSENCRYVNSQHIAYSCFAVLTTNKNCVIELLQIWENADYRIRCNNGFVSKKLINPGPVPETMD